MMRRPALINKFDLISTSIFEEFEMPDVLQRIFIGISRSESRKTLTLGIRTVL